MKGDDKMIKWSKNYLMGIDKLDEEHKELFRISDQIYNKVMERGDDAKYRLFLMKETLEYMLRYFKRHAKSEEIYMREIGYAGYEFHKMLHDEFYNMLLKKKDSRTCGRWNWMAFGTYNNRRYGNCRERNLSHIFIQ